MLRERPVVVQHERPVRERPARERPVSQQIAKEGKLNYCEITNRLWAVAVKGFKCKDDLERAVRTSGIKTLPDIVDDKLAAAALLMNKGMDERAYITKYGHKQFNEYILLWKSRIEVIFHEMRK